MATNRARPTRDDESLSDADRAAIERALAEPGITLSADELAALLATADDEVHELIAAGQVAEAIGLARFYAFERDYNWDEPRNRPLPLDIVPLDKTPLTWRWATSVNACLCDITCACYTAEQPS